MVFMAFWRAMVALKSNFVSVRFWVWKEDSRTHGDVHDEGSDGVHGLLEGSHLLPQVVQLLVQPLLGASTDWGGSGRRWRGTGGSGSWGGRGSGGGSHKLTSTSVSITSTATSGT